MKSLSLILISSLLALAVCEGILRVAWDDVLPRPDLYVLDADVGKRMRPGWRGSEFGTAVVISSQGLRNRETPYSKPPGTYRVLALGDSWTFGFRVAEPASYPRRLEATLNERARARGSHSTIEVINSGVVGYSTHQEGAYLQVEGYRYEPDLVVVAFYPVNDAEDKSSRYVRYHRLRDIHPWVLDLYTLPRRLYLRQFWKGTRRALKYRAAELRSALAARLGRDDPGARAIVEGDWTHRFSEGHRGWELAREGLRTIGTVARRLGAPALAVLLPDVQDLARYEDRYHPKIAPMIRRAAGEAELDWFDLIDRFRPYRGREDEIRFPGQRHPNEAGYALIARAVADVIENRYLRREEPTDGRRTSRGSASAGAGPSPP